VEEVEWEEGKPYSKMRQMEEIGRVRRWFMGEGIGKGRGGNGPR
jgi:hypothetical protein